MEAVKENGFVLEYVEEQTEEMRLCAVKENKDALKYVDKIYSTVICKNEYDIVNIRTIITTIITTIIATVIAVMISVMITFAILFTTVSIIRLSAFLAHIQPI